MNIILNGEEIKIRERVYSRYEDFNENGGIFVSSVGEGRFEILDFEFNINFPASGEISRNLELHQLNISTEDKLFNEWIKTTLNSYQVNPTSSIGEIITRAYVNDNRTKGSCLESIEVNDVYNLSEDELSSIKSLLEKYAVID